MRICLLTYRGNPYCGGQGIYIYYLSRELTKLGHEVEVIAGPPYPEVPQGVRLHKLKGLNLYESNDSFFGTISCIRNPVDFYEFIAVCLGFFPEPLTFSLRAYYKLRRLLSQQKFDIIHDNQGLGYGLLLMKRFKIPLIATVHHPISIDRKLQLAEIKSLRERLRLKKWYSFCRMQARVAKYMDRVITVSESSRQTIMSFLNLPYNSLRVIHNGVDLDLFKRTDSIQGKQNSLILINSGEQPIKGVTYLLEALKILRNGTGFKLTIVGCPKRDGQYLRLVEEYGLGDLVNFTGRVTREELVDHYLSSEVCVVPSLYEGFGFPAVEAMSCKLPVVATTGGALPELLGKDGDAGILVPPADPYALAAAIKRLLDDRHLRQKMGESGRKRMERHFTWEEAARKHLKVYQEVL